MVDFDDFGGDRAVDLPIRRLDRAKTAIRGAFLEVFVQFWVMLKNILPDLLSPEGRAWWEESKNDVGMDFGEVGWPGMDFPSRV